MIKIIFSDFDNTMLDYYSENNYFDDYKIGVLKRVKDKRIKFCIVTGRSVSFFKQFPNLMGVVDYILGSNGACIYDVVNDKYIYQEVFSEDSFNEIVGYLVENNNSFLLNCKGERYRYGEWDAINCLDYDNGKNYLCDQIIFRVLKSDFDRVFKRLENISNIKINNMSEWEGYWSVDLNVSDVSKGKSVVWLCNYLDIDVNDVMAFGDGDNDKSMFEEVNKGVAVGNAVDKLKILSKDIALNCDDNGIYKYIEDNILK